LEAFLSCIANARMQRSRTLTVEKGGEVRVYNEGAIRHNATVVEYCRTCTAVFSGMGAGFLDSLVSTDLVSTFCLSLDSG